MVNELVSVDDDNNKQFIEYDGIIKYLKHFNSIAEASNSLIEWIDQQGGNALIPLSFDMEWPVSFKTGTGKTAVIQICIELNCCYIFQIYKLWKLPAALVALLKHKRVRLYGVNIKNDIYKLAKDFPEIQSQDILVNCIDLGVWCNEICEMQERWSLERLALYTINQKMNKNRKVRMSKWHFIPLRQEQLNYAAIDVYVGLLIYRELKARLDAKVCRN